METCSIRRAGQDDVAAITPLFDAYRQFYGMVSAPELAAAYLHARLSNAESTIFIAENRQGTPIGFCQLYFSFCSVAMARTSILYDLFVAASARGQGAGKALLATGEAHSAREGAVRIGLQTETTNLRAQQLYGAAGWTRTMRFHGYTKALSD